LGADRARGHEHYERTKEFVELFDNPAFDPACPMEPIDSFLPMLRRFMATPKNSVYKAALEKV
jgi:hypothetical protein